MTINPLPWLGAVGALASALVAVPAIADPWTMPAGKGRVIVTAIYSQASRTFDDQGKAQQAPDYDQYQVYFQGEYGVTDDLTLLATPSLRRVTVQNGDDSSGLGYTQLGARYRLFNRDGFVVSAQASEYIPGVRRRDRVAQIGSTDFQTDLRAQIGYSFKIGRVDAFASADGGYRFRGDGQPNEIHGDFTLGIHATKRLLLVGNSFNTWSDGAGSQVPAYRYNSIYAGAAYDLSDHVTLQLGGLTTASGRNALRERGIYTGVWIKF
ncbi:MAG: hypothetical protein ABIS14_03305 [Sphingomonas sp.]